MRDRVITIGALLLLGACGPHGSRFFAPASRGVQTLPPDAEFCYLASEVPVYSNGVCPPEPRVSEAVNAAALLPTDKEGLRILVTGDSIVCAGKFASSCSDGWTVTVRAGSLSRTLPMELRNLLASRAGIHLVDAAGVTNYEALPGWQQ